jgi:Aromatic-ring-opening dioxygenase LigAB, LigA subunit
MSSYHLNRFLFDLKMNEGVLKRASSSVQEAAQEYDLTEEEKEAVQSRDPRRLRQLGAHGMLALYILRLDPDFRANIYWTQK